MTAASHSIPRLSAPLAAPIRIAALLALCASAAGCTTDFTDSTSRPDAGPGECGDGVLNSGELCDGTDLGGQTCLSALHHQHGTLGCDEDCRLDFSDCHTCGDGMLDGPETCDDENTDNDDGCSDQCQTEPGWVCTGQPSVCAFTCGNGTLDLGEVCDDGNLTANDGCSPNCQTEPGWVCTGEPSVCTPVCGDGVLKGPEDCDDGNTAPNDGCSESCTVETGWFCAGEPSTCIPACGDGLIVASETCDDGNNNDGDGCSAQCWIEPGWQCSGQPSACTTICGDGQIIGPEQCDDGNNAGGDGCSNTCVVEDYHACSGEPSDCVCAVFVNNDPNIPTRNGRSWSTAFAAVQPGISQAASLGGGCEVWVAEGTYHIYQNNAWDTLNLAGGVAVYGGFSGTESARDQRDWANRQTILDGAHATNPSMRVYNVVTATNITNAVLDGFIVTGGNSAGAANNEGAGLRSASSTLTVANCRFEDNQAVYGGGIHTYQGQITLTNCEIINNFASEMGAGLDVQDGAVTVQRCTFQGNDAGDRGGGMYITQANATLDSCVFLNNTAAQIAGGLRVFSAAVNVTNSVFSGNQANGTAGDGGGAIGSDGAMADVDIINCTFYGNRAPTSSGGALFVIEGTATVANSILWSNQPSQIFVTGATCLVTYSTVEGGYSGTGNLTSDPQLSAPQNGDFHLVSGSPCIDAANGDVAPASDIEGNPRADDPNKSNTGVGNPNYVDMGAFEFQP